MNNEFVSIIFALYTFHRIFMNNICILQGKYKMSISNIELCKGAKKSNLTTSFLQFENVDNILYVNGNYTLSKEVGPVMVNVT